MIRGILYKEVKEGNKVIQQLVFAKSIPSHSVASIAQ